MCELIASVALITVLYFQSITVHIIYAFSILKALTSQSNKQHPRAWEGKHSFGEEIYIFQVLITETFFIYSDLKFFNSKTTEQVNTVAMERKMFNFKLGSLYYNTKLNKKLMHFKIIFWKM